MTKKLRIAIAQINLTVGDIETNLKKHIDAAVRARDEYQADMIVFPELGLTGYPPEDLLFRSDFLSAAQAALETFIATVKDIHCVISYPHATSHGLLNTCSIVYNGAILGRYAKQHLPNYGVFDEERYFTPGNSPCVIPINGIPIGIVVCEDLWFPGPVQQAAAQGARIIISPNASPFEVDKHEQRMAILTKRAKQDRVAIVYANGIGGQDDLVFDGGSMVIDEHGEIAAFAGFFNETILPVEIEVNTVQTHINKETITLPTDLEKIYSALVLAVRDYVNKNNFSGVYIGVSGGIDSALTLAIAVDALGKDRVEGIIMPSRHTSQISMEEAAAIATNSGIASQIISIEPAYEAFTQSLASTLTGLADENLQARCRGVILMALSNQFGKLVLTTGNRSELAVGYCTLYGDMAGGFCVLKDIPKTLVFELARYRNTISTIIPERTITRAPTAELAPNQKDQDSLPPYDILDQIIYLYLNDEKSADEIVAAGFDREIVMKIIQLIRKTEYKRHQSAPGPRINNKSFGIDRRYPITNKF